MDIELSESERTIRETLHALYERVQQLEAELQKVRKVMSDDKLCDMVSHGICKECKETYFHDIKLDTQENKSCEIGHENL